MNELANKDFGEVTTVLRKRFPQIHCVRCGSDNFLTRVWQDDSLSPAFSDHRMVEIICENCGFVERHMMEGLKGELSAVESDSAPPVDEQP